LKKHSFLNFPVKIRAEGSNKLSKEKKHLRELDKIADKIHRRLEEKDSARELGLKTCREIIRLSSTAIRAIHRKENLEAMAILESASDLVEQINSGFEGKYRDLISANYVHDAVKEYAEASITYSIIFNGAIPDPDKLGVAYPAYLNGLAESVGELRRFILDGLRRDDFASAERLLSSMDHIYTVLVTMDFPDAITFGLRRNTDNVRGIVEKTRGELTLIMQNNSLREDMASVSKKLSSSAH
jgi:translin